MHRSRPFQRGKQAIGDTLSPHKLLQQNEQKKDSSNQKTILSDNHSRLAKLTNNTGDESFHIERVSLSLRMQIQKARNAKRLSQKDLAFRIGVTAKTIHDYECGKAIPDHQVIQKIQKCLCVKFERS